MNATWKLSRLSTESFAQEKLFLRQMAERVEYKLRPGYANVDAWVIVGEHFSVSSDIFSP